MFTLIVASRGEDVEVIERGSAAVTTASTRTLISCSFNYMTASLVEAADEF